MDTPAKLIIRKIGGKRTDCIRFNFHPITLTSIYLSSQVREELKECDISFHNGYLLIDFRYEELFYNWLKSKNLIEERK